MPIYTHQTKNSHFLKNWRFSVWCGWVLVHQGELKKNGRPTVRPVSNFPNKHSWQILKILECAITHFSFLVKNRRNKLRSATLFSGVTYQWLFCYFAFKIFFWYLRPKKRCDGRRKTKIKKLTSKNIRGGTTTPPLMFRVPNPEPEP